MPRIAWLVPGRPWRAACGAAAAGRSLLAPGEQQKGGGRRRCFASAEEVTRDPSGGFGAGAAWPPSKLAPGNSFLTENNSLRTDFYRQDAAGNRYLPETTEDNTRQRTFTVSPRHPGPKTG